MVEHGLRNDGAVEADVEFDPFLVVVMLPYIPFVFVSPCGL